MAADSFGQAKAGGSHVDEGVGGFGETGRIIRRNDQRVAFHDHPESERGQPFDLDLLERPRAQTVRSRPYPQAFILDLDMNRETSIQVPLILNTSFEFSDDAPPGSSHVTAPGG